MRIIHNYSLDDNTHPGYFTIISEEEHFCNGCHRLMKCKDRRERIGRTLDGGCSVYLLRRMYCYECHIMHTELPDFLLKFKHFEAQIIEDTLDGYITPEDCYEAPSEMTMLRWQAWFASICSAMDFILCSVRAVLENILQSLRDETSLVGALRKRGSGWLATAFSVIINAGRYP